MAIVLGTKYEAVNTAPSQWRVVRKQTMQYHGGKTGVEETILNRGLSRLHAERYARDYELHGVQERVAYTPAYTKGGTPDGQA